MKQQNKNFIFNVGYQLLTYVFPLVTIPYTSRILGVDNVGIYSYTYSIAYLFVLGAMLGISNYGNREIARVRDDEYAVSKTFISIYSLQLVLGIIASVIYLIYAWVFCKEYILITRLQIIFVVSSCIDVSWFYFGLEKFKMTITRNLIIKIVSLGMIFLVVRNKNDLWKYTIIMASATFISQLYLFVKLHGYIRIIKVSVKDVTSHFQSVLILFIPVLAFSIYRVMDKTMIGYFSNVTELGYYENAERLINIPVSVINALGTVMLPYMAHLFYTEKGQKSVNKAICESMDVALILSTTMATGLILIANDAAIVFFGQEFKKSGTIIIILSVTIIASAWANVVRTQYLIPKRKDSIYVKSTIFGAVANFICNSIFIKLYGAYGACIGTVIAEYFIMLYQSVAVGNELPQRFFVKRLLRSLLSATAIMGLTYVLTVPISNLTIRLVMKIVIAMILFTLFNRSFIRKFWGVKRGGRKNECKP